MSLAGGQGAANDPAVEIQERLADIPADPHTADRVALHHELYKIQHRVPGTIEHAAHRAQLLRLHRAAQEAARNAANSVDRAEHALGGAREALGNAQAAELEAAEAVEAFDRDHGTPDGSAE